MCHTSTVIYAIWVCTITIYTIEDSLWAYIWFCILLTVWAFAWCWSSAAIIDIIKIMVDNITKSRVILHICICWQFSIIILFRIMDIFVLIVNYMVIYNIFISVRKCSIDFLNVIYYFTTSQKKTYGQLSIVTIVEEIELEL